MAAPTNLLDLALDSEGLADADVGEVVARAAEIVEGFAENAAPQALEAILTVAGQDNPALAADAALSIARQSSAQAGVLSDEVNRFLSMTDDA